MALTKENCKIVSTVINKNHPEWGVKRFNYDVEGFHSVGVGSNSAHLFEHEFQFWNVVSFK